MSQFSVQKVKRRGWGQGCAALGGRPHNMSTVRRHIFLVFTGFSTTAMLTKQLMYKLHCISIVTLNLLFKYNVQS